jgi:hypothetical protein
MSNCRGTHVVEYHYRRFLWSSRFDIIEYSSDSTVVEVLPAHTKRKETWVA